MSALRALSLMLTVVALGTSCGADGTGPGQKPVASVTVAPLLDTIAPAATVQLTATAKDAAGNPVSGRTVTWSSSSPSVATVSSTGLVTGVDSGSVAITASVEGKNGGATIAVYTRVASVTVTPAIDTTLPTATVQLTATLMDGTGNPLTGRVVTWSTSSSSIATVSGGLVTGVTDGPATITATSEGKTGSATIQVHTPVASVTVAPALDTIAPDGTVQLTASPKDSVGNPLNGHVVSWSSSDSLVAKVSGTGSVAGQSAGSATITATSEGKSGTATIAVVVPLDVSGTWVFAESLADIPNGYVCHDTATIGITQTVSRFTGTWIQTGTCATPTGPADNGGTYSLADGVVSGTTVHFLTPEGIPCRYSGTLAGDPPSSMAGIVFCILGTSSFSGTWHATRTGMIAAAVGASSAPGRGRSATRPGERFRWVLESRRRRGQ